MPQVKIHLELTLPVESVTVNTIIVLFQQILTQVVAQMVAGWLTAWQEAQLDYWLGPRRGTDSESEKPWACPGCQSRQGFNRRGWRRRVLRQTSLGRIPFPLRQVTCQRCGKTFAPFQGRLGLAPYQVSTLEFRERAATAVCQVSYRRGAEWVSTTPLSATVSPTAIHNWVQAAGEAVEFEAEVAEGQTLLLDGTEVKAGRDKRGVSLHLGLAITDRDNSGHRPQLKKRVVALSVDTDWQTTLAPLAEVQPERIVYDGETELVEVIESQWPTTPCQRCLWHLVTNLYHALWKDGLNKSQVQPVQERLSQLLYCLSPLLAQAAYQALQDELQLLGLENGSRYLRKAASAVFTFHSQAQGLWHDRAWQPDTRAIVATSPLEREMREINRRTDNGSRWSIPGVRNLVTLDLIRRYEPGQWQQLWLSAEKPTVSYSDVNVLIETVCSMPNVNTS